VQRWGTDLDAALANPDDTVFFDAGTTQMRPTLLAKAIRAGKHVYCEKPIATNLERGGGDLPPGAGIGPQARRGAGQAVPARPAQAGHAAPRGFFGRMLSVRGEFGYWVFEGDLQPIQRPSWNYRAKTAAA
jgi:hypothetical protein